MNITDKIAVLRWVKNVSFIKQILTVSSINGILSVLSAVGSILFVHNLTLSDYGVYSVIFAYIQFVGPMGTSGQSTLLKSVYSVHEGISRKWFKHLTTGLLINIPVYLLSLFILPFIGIRKMEYTLVLTGIIIGYGLIHYLCSLLDSIKYYILSSLLIRIPFVLMIIPAVLMTFKFKFHISDLLLFFFIFEILSSLVGFLIISNTKKIELNININSKRLKSVSYSIQLFLHLLPNQGMILIAGRLFPKAIVGMFSALWILFRPFWIFYDSTARISSVELANKIKNKIYNIFIKYSLIFLGIGFISIFIYPIGVNLIYGDKIGLHSLIYWFIFVNTIMLFNSLPVGYLSMRLPNISIFRYTSILMLGGLAGIVVIYLTFKPLGIYCIVLSMLTIMFSRMITVYYFSIKDINKNRAG